MVGRAIFVVASVVCLLQPADGFGGSRVDISLKWSNAECLCLGKGCCKSKQLFATDPADDEMYNIKEKPSLLDEMKQVER
jgi:hypothetical protein